MWDLNKRLLVLDIDETLLFTLKTPIPEYHRQPDQCVYPWYVYERPWARQFLAKVAADPKWEFCVFSKSSDDYVRGVLASLLPNGVTPLYVFSKKNLVVKHKNKEPVYTVVGGYGEKVTFKDLKKVKRKTGAPYSHILVVDDQPMMWPRQYGNVVPIPEHNPTTDKQEHTSPSLARVYEFMKTHEHAPDLRCPEKRWLFTQSR